MEGIKPFQQVSMDLITGLPSRKGYDTILTIEDHGCSRAAIFLPCTTKITGLGFAQLYLEHIYQWWGLPIKIISDRDPRFTSHFGRNLTKKLGIQQNLSTTAHPQTDGLSEHKNQWIEQYLWIITSAHPEDWVDWLAITTAVHNNRRNSTTGLSPNQILWGQEAMLNPEVNISSPNEAAEDRVKRLLEVQKTAIQAINRITKHPHQIPDQYKVGEQVWLEATHLRLPFQTSKLNPKRYGPFQIQKQISPVALKLTLPAAWGSHHTFHALLLSPYHKTPAHGLNFLCPPPDLIDEVEEYDVEKVVDHRYHGRKKALQYLLKWKRYLESDNTCVMNDSLLLVAGP